MAKDKKKFQLSNHQKILGAKYCYENAIALLDEAKILIDNSKWARATALSILGIEEISKIELIGQTFFYTSHKEWEKFEEKFLKHNQKLRLADYLLIQTAYQSGDDKKLENELEQILKGRNLNIGKQRCFYVGFDQDNLWQVPLKIVSEDDALYCKKLLETLIESYKLIFERSHNEIVDIIRKMKQYLPSEEVKVNEEKMKSDIQKKAINIKSNM
jgi:AbiV family abortive infection protein